MKAGAAGISMGRNAFQHENPTMLVKAACAIVHQGMSVQEALQLITS
jgi:DhnA family fructose-bisphosphate aldolase class Ia